MTGARIPLHARNHLPGGSDPLPVGDNNGWPTAYRISLASVDGNIWENAHLASDPMVVDSACVNNARLMMGGTDGAYFVNHLRLGPRGSIWSVSVRHTKGSDHGKLFFDWATVSENIPLADYPLPSGFDDDGGGAMQAAAGDGLTYVRYTGSGAGEDNIDGYAASPSSNTLTSAVSEFRIMGNAGATLTAFTPTGNISGLRSIADGGPGLWNFRPIIDGKNGSSSSYQFGIVELLVRREDWEGF